MTMTSLPDDILDLLTAYALDVLEPAEIAQVLALLEERPELRTTLAELRATVNELPYALPEVVPSPDLRQRVLDHATGRATPRRQSPPVELARQARGWFLALGSLALVAIVAAIISWSRLAGVEADLVRVRSELATAQAMQQQVADVILQQQTIATLTGGGSGRLVRTSDGRAVLAAQLPPLRPGRVYQLWLIQGSNAPVSGGIFTVDQQGRGVLTLAPTSAGRAADTVAVTDEPDPGSSGPTTTPLIVGKFS